MWIWAGGSCATRCGSTPPTTTSRSTSWCRASPKHILRPRHLRQLHREGDLEAGQNDTVIGYYQQGRKQKPRRGISALLPAESVRAQDSYSRMYKGEWQKVLTDRTFFNVNVGNFTLDWPMVVAVDPATNAPKVFRTTTAVAGAGWNAFSTHRKKPQLKAQLTYYLPEKAGSHDFKFGFETINDSYRYGHNGTSGGIRYSYPCADTSCAPDRIRFVDTGAASDYDSGWTVGANTDRHYAGYLQDRWAAEQQVDLHVRHRASTTRRSATTTPRASPSSPTSWPTAPGSSRSARRWRRRRSFSNTNFAPRLGATWDVKGTGQFVLKAFYGRYYNNLADGFSAINPGGQSLPSPTSSTRTAISATTARRSSARCACAPAPTTRRSIPTSRRRTPTRSAGRSSSSCPVSRRPASPTSARTTTTSRRSTARTWSRRGSARSTCRRARPSGPRARC